MPVTGIPFYWLYKSIPFWGVTGISKVEYK